MGKYMRKAKTTGEMAVMELTQTAIGVRTRAKTLALQRLQQKSQPASPEPATSGSFLQLRSRRLEKTQLWVPIHDSKRQRQKGGQKESAAADQANPSARRSSRSRMGSLGSETNDKVMGQRVKAAENIQGNNENVDVEDASFGENVLDVEGRERSTRESTPCSLLGDLDGIRTPGSTTRTVSSAEANQRIENSMRRHLPTSHEMDQFFTSSEEEQRRQFVDKYNFDPVNEKPLPGRYEWEKLNP